MYKFFFVLLFLPKILFGQDSAKSIIISDVARLQLNPTHGPQVINGYLPKNGKVIIIGEIGDYWKAIFKDKEGFIYKKFIMENNQLNELHYNLTKGEYGPKSKEIKKKFGNKVANRIFAAKVWIGMTKEMATYSQGKPKDINTTVTKYSSTEQWVYRNLLLYFEGDKLTAWQEY